MIQRDPDYSKAYSMLGRIYCDAGDCKKAIEKYKIAIEKNPDNFIAMFNLANIYKAQENHQESFRLYNRILENCPNKEMVQKAREKLESLEKT